MSTNEFDQKLREQYDQGGFDYNPAAWKNVLQQLDTIQPAVAKKRLVWLPLTGMAASLALIAVLSFFFYRQHTDHIPVAVQSHTQTTTPVAATQPVPAATPLVPTVQPPASAAKTPAAIPARPQHIQQPLQQQSTIAATTQQSPIENTNTLPQSATPSTSEPKNQTTKKPANTTGYLPDESFLANNNDKITKNSFSVAGGVNYGTLNTGYSLAVNARRSLSSKFYVEGDLAFINNNNPQSTTNLSPVQYGAVSNHNGSVGTAAEYAANNGTAVNNLYYLQFAPTVGYHIFKKLSVGLGADIQRMLQNNDGKTVAEDNGSLKVVPGTDVGVVAKTEYAITPRLKTGLMYREGVNGLADSKYLDRRYLQVQLKLRLFGK